MTLSNTLVEDPAEPGTYLLDPFEPNVQQVITSEGTGAILFGADPTGNTPVQDELLAASRLASGRNLPLIVTDGNYLITDAPGLPNDLTIMCAANARFFGNRPGGNLLWIQSKVRIYGGIFENTSSEACFDINVVGGSGVEFHGVTFKGGGANGIFLNWPGIDELLVDNCLFDTLVYGMLLNPGAGDAKNITIRRSRFRNIAADAVEINNMTSGGSTRVEGFKFIDNPEVRCDANVSGTSAGFGLGLAGCSEFTITGNTFLECRNETVHIEDHSSGGVIADNTIRGGSNNERGAIVIYQSCADIRVHDNVIRDFPAKGVAVVYDGNGASKDISIQNNTIVNCGKTAIQVGGGETGQGPYIIKGNTILNPDGNGIEIFGAHELSVVTDNVIVSPTHAGILTAGANSAKRYYKNNVVTSPGTVAFDGVLETV